MKRCAGPLSFLIVEDEPFISMDMELLIEDAGHEVIGTAVCIEEVKALPEGCAPNVALIDMHLAQGGHGLDVSAYIQSRWPDALVVFVTGSTRDIPLDFGGAHGVIAKPFSTEGFFEAIQYLGAGDCDPPPVSPRSGNFVASKAFAANWGDDPNRALLFE